MQHRIKQVIYKNNYCSGKIVLSYLNSTPLSDKNKNHEPLATKITQKRLDMIRKDSKGKTGLETIDQKSLNLSKYGVTLPLIEFNSVKPKRNGK